MKDSLNFGAYEKCPWKEEYSERFQTSKIEFFWKKLKLVTIFAKSSFLDVSQGSEPDSVNDFIFQLVFRLELPLV